MNTIFEAGELGSTRGVGLLRAHSIPGAVNFCRRFVVLNLLEQLRPEIHAWGSHDILTMVLK